MAVCIEAKGDCPMDCPLKPLIENVDLDRKGLVIAQGKVESEECLSQRIPRNTSIEWGLNMANLEFYRQRNVLRESYAQLQARRSLCKLI